MKEEIKKWIEQADKDFDVAKYNLDGGKIEAGVFFLQQAAEKALKAVYIKKFEKLKKTHDLILLAQEVDAPAEIFEFCKDVTPAYQYTRYPDMPLMENLEESVDKFVNDAEEILKWAKENI